MLLATPDRRIAIIGDSTLELTRDTRLRLYVPLPDGTRADEVDGEVVVEGDTDVGLPLNPCRAVLTRVSPSSSEPFHDVAEFELLGANLGVSAASAVWTRQVLYLKNGRYLGRGRAVLGPYSLELQNTPRENIATVSAGEILSTLSIQRDAATSDDTTDLRREACLLLTVASRCPIVSVICEGWNGERLVFVEIFGNHWDYVVTHPMIDWSSRDSVAFVVATHAAYRAGTNYNIALLAEYYWRAHVETTGEIKFMFASVFMEALKFAWAKNISALIQDKKQNGLIRGFKRTIADKRAVSFEDLVNEAATALAFDASLLPFTFIDNRNAIFHSGEASARQLGHSASWPHMQPELERLFDQLDETVLRILGYQGEFRRWAEPNAAYQFPGRQRIR